MLWSRLVISFLSKPAEYRTYKGTTKNEIKFIEIFSGYKSKQDVFAKMRVPQKYTRFQKHQWKTANVVVYFKRKFLINVKLLYPVACLHIHIYIDAYYSGKTRRIRLTKEL